MTRLLSTVLFGIVLVVSSAFILLTLYSRGEDQATRDITKTEMNGIAAALNRFEADCGRYPDTAEGLDALLHAPPALAYRWHGPYLEKIPDMDAWAHPYLYQSEKGEDFNLTSLGENGRPDQSAEGDDLVQKG